jgi:hypothetical protein
MSSDGTLASSSAECTSAPDDFFCRKRPRTPVTEQNPKSQHYVQRAYLEGFQDPQLEGAGENLVWVYLPEKSPFRQRPGEVAVINYYYCHQDEETRKFDAEHHLQRLEDLAMPALHDLRLRQFDLSPQDRLTFAGYIALSHTRVPAFERSMNRLSSLVTGKQLELTTRDDKALQAVVNDMKQRSGEDITLEEFRKQLTGGTVKVTQENRGWSLRQMFHMLLFLQEVIFKMEWTFFVAPEGDSGFLTSDNPVSLFDPMGGIGGTGFASSPAAHFTFPVSREVCLLAKHQSGPASIKLSASQVRFVNKATIERVDSQLYAPFRSLSVQAILDSVIKTRPAKKEVLLKKGKLVEE